MSLKNKEFKEGNLAVYVMTHGPECTWLDDYCIPMELGAAKRDNLRYATRDDEGEDNISEKNGLYNELTGLYRMWKNDNHEYVGLYHYRRIFNLSREQINNILGEVDIIVGVIVNKPNIEDAYIRWHMKDDWDAMMDTLKSMYPDYYHDAVKFFGKSKLIPCNMFISKREILESYCEWLFPLLFSIEPKLNLYNRSLYQSRAIGFLGERLFGVWILHNNLNISVNKIKFIPPYFLKIKLPEFVNKIIMNNLYIYNYLIHIQNKIYSISIKLYSILKHTFLKKYIDKVRAYL